jgi:hypothetical protein
MITLVECGAAALSPVVDNEAGRERTLIQHAKQCRMMTMRGRVARCRVRKSAEWGRRRGLSGHNGCDPACPGRESHNATHGPRGRWTGLTSRASSSWMGSLCFSSWRRVGGVRRKGEACPGVRRAWLNNLTGRLPQRPRGDKRARLHYTMPPPSSQAAGRPATSLL